MFCNQMPNLAPTSHAALASFPKDAVAPQCGGGHPDEVRWHPLDPRLKPRAADRCALGLGIQMMRRSPYQHHPPFARLQIELVGLHGDLVLGVRDTSTQVFVKKRRVPRAQDNRLAVDLVHDRQRRGPISAVIDQAPEPFGAEQL